jgi:hypothetical protein
MKNSKNLNTEVFEKKISRKDAIKKVGVVALTTSSLLFLNTKVHAKGSCDYPGGGGGPQPQPQPDNTTRPHRHK